MKFLLSACVLVGVASAKMHGNLQPRFMAKNLPETTQDYHRGEDEEEALEHGYEHEKERHTDLNYTPGKACSAFTTCEECPAPGPCVWVPHDIHDTLNKFKAGNGDCMEQRNPLSENGELNYMCKLPHMEEVMDVPNDEGDDYSELHINGDPNEVDIAVLNRAEPVFTEAQELGVGEGPESEAAGDWMVGGMDHQEYEGHVDKEKIKKHAEEFAKKRAEEEAER